MDVNRGTAVIVKNVLPVKLILKGERPNKNTMIRINSSSSQQDVHLSADGQISHSAGESINLSTQQSLIAHASQKLSLFAAQDGARLYAGKGKIEIQAQGDGADLIARKGVQIISTEDTVYITSPTEINLTAGGSQIKINGSGIFPTTGGKFEVKAGQHSFVSGEKLVVDLPSFPELIGFVA